MKAYPSTEPRQDAGDPMDTIAHSDDPQAGEPRAPSRGRGAGRAPPPLPPEEPRRLAALAAMRVLDTPREPAYDRIVRLAVAHFRVPVAVITLVDDDRAWIKASAGLAAAQFGRDASFCAHAILSDEALVVRDTSADARFRACPLVEHEPWIAFYAGHPLHAATGERVGVLALMDDAPRAFSAADGGVLADLAAMASAALQARVERQSHLAVVEELAVARRDVLVDPYTRLWNAQAMIDLLARERLRAMRLRSALSVLAVRLEGYGRLCEARGRPQGEDLLREMARRFGRAVRAYDHLGRVGPDEFRAVLNPARLGEARLVAERMLRVAAAVGALPGEGPTITAGIGVATCHYGREQLGPAALVHAAGERLEAALRSGRSRIAAREVTG